jgi:hypothetical protein
LNNETKQDIVMWKHLLDQWNGVSMFIDPAATVAPDMELYTDASRVGYAGYYQGLWFSDGWPESLRLTWDKDVSMTFCELYPIVVAAIVWGNQWTCKHILFHCDNTGAVHAINKGRSKSPHIMALMRRLVLVAAQYNFSYCSEHVPGIHNGISDALLRFQMERFRQLACIFYLGLLKKVDYRKTLSLLCYCLH